jgi:hypothetical protein
MQRRNFINKFLKLAALAFTGSVGWGENQFYRVVIFNQSIKPAPKGYEDVNQFWDHHYDAYAAQLNREFLETGKLVQVDTYLINGGRAAILVKYYKSKKDHLDYVERLESFHNQMAVAPLDKSEIIFG